MITLCVTNFVIICHFVISGQSISQQKSSGGSPQGVPPPTARIFGRNGGVPNGNPPYGALLKPSVVKPVFATLEQALIIRQLGTLALADKIALKNAISQILG